MYRLKRINYEGKRVAICTQNDNGPCPLLAIANIWILRGHISFGLTDNYIASSKLLEVLSSKLVETNTTKKVDKNREQAVADVLKILPGLQRGLDVNVKFASPKSFEFTTNLSTFDLFQTNLVHGWLPDPRAVYAAEVSKLSYDQVVERAIDKVEVPKPAVATAVAVAVAVPVATGTTPATATTTADGSTTAAAALVVPVVATPPTDASTPSPTPTTLPPVAAPVATTVPVDATATVTATATATPALAPAATVTTTPPSSAPTSPEVKRVDTPTTYACPACTFINQFAAEVCAVCGGKRPASLSGGFAALFASPKRAATRPATPPLVAVPTAAASSSSTAAATAADAKVSPPYIYRSFLDDTAGQFTSYGLEQLQRAVEEKELCVFFRNNHFSVLTKLRGKLYSLITDEGFANHVNIIWESLESAKGDGVYVTAEFAQPTPQQAAQTASSFVSDADMKAILELSSRESGPPPTKRPRSSTPPLTPLTAPIPSLAPSEVRLAGSLEEKAFDLGPKNAEYWECPKCTTHNKPDDIDCTTCMEWQCQYCDNWNRSKFGTCQGMTRNEKCGRDKRLLTQGDIKQYAEIAKKRRDAEWKSFVANQLKKDPQWIVPPQPGSEEAKKQEAAKKAVEDAKIKAEKEAKAKVAADAEAARIAALPIAVATVVTTPTPAPAPVVAAAPVVARAPSTPAITTPTVVPTPTPVVATPAPAAAAATAVVPSVAAPPLVKLPSAPAPLVTAVAAVVPPVVAAAADPNALWTCPSCQFDHNEASMTDCDFCNLPRGHAA